MANPGRLGKRDAQEVTLSHPLRQSDQALSGLISGVVSFAPAPTKPLIMPMSAPTLLIAAAAFALVLSFALNQGCTCAVRAARELVVERRTRLMLGFAVAVGAAGLVWLGLAWSGVAGVTRAGELPIDWPLFVGAALLGPGAVINNACMLATIARIGDGEVRFLALPAGLAIGFAAAGRLRFPTHPPASINPLMRISEVGLLMTALGVSGATLFAVAPGWSYADVVQHGVAPVGMMGLVSGPAGALAGAALVAGVGLAGLRTRRFRFQRTGPAILLRSIAGGAVMAVGAAMVPVGNDTMLLAAPPAATLSGAVGNLVMTGTVVGLLLVARHGWPALRRLRDR